MTLTPELKAKIDDLVTKNKIMVFMKGNKLMPQCGFSNNVVQILNILGVTTLLSNNLAFKWAKCAIFTFSNRIQEFSQT